MDPTMSLRRVLALLLAFGVVAALALASACGGDDDDGDGGDDGGSAAATTPAATGDGGDGDEVTFDVSMGDNLFDPAELTVPAGAVVTVNLTNDGVAIHNMRIAGADNEYNSGDDAVSDPDLISGGDRGTLEWTVPEEPGEYDFQCDFHVPGMVGTITVE